MEETLANIKLHDNIEDKQALLDEYEVELTKDKNIDFKTLLIMLLSMFVTLSILLPGIYIKNEIYYISRDINKLDEEHTLLNEENRALMRKIEAIRFKNQVLDDILFEDSFDE